MTPINNNQMKKTKIEYVYKLCGTCESGFPVEVELPISIIEIIISNYMKEHKVKPISNYKKEKSND